MKNDNTNQIRQGRAPTVHAQPTDILVVPGVVQNNMARLASKPRRKRRTNYAKKIMNDDFIMNA